MGIQQRREREREARRRAVLDAARSLVRERGFNGTTTKQIAQRCELSEATLFWYFQNKDEIMTSLLFEGIDFMTEGLEAIVDKDAPPAGKLESLWKFFLRVREEHPEYIHVFTYLGHPHAADAVTEDVKREILRRSGANFELLTEIVRGACGNATPRVAVDLVWAAFAGLMVLRDSRLNLGARPHPTDREMTAAFKLLLSGLSFGDGKAAH